MTKILLFLTIFISLPIESKEILPIPRFASLKSNEVNARAGPNLRYPIEWVFIKKKEPVEIIAEFENWRRIRDISGEGGWVHSNMLSGKRFVIVKGGDLVDLYNKASDSSKVIAKVSPSVRCELNKCDSSMCLVICDKYKGWLKRQHLWGVYPEETN